MRCPNEDADMREVRLVSNASQAFIVDQCPKCGGIWFDQFELYRAKDAEWQKLDDIDAQAFRESTDLASPARQCPRDAANLVRFSDRYFPSGIVVEKCPRCDGFWLNRAEFRKFQEARQELRRPREIVIEPTPPDDQIRGALAMHEANPMDSPLVKAARFLSSPLDQTPLEPLESGPGRATADSVNAALNILMTLLRLFVLK